MSILSIEDVLENIKAKLAAKEYVNIYTNMDKSQTGDIFTGLWGMSVLVETSSNQIEERLNLITTTLHNNLQHNGYTTACAIYINKFHHINTIYNVTINVKAQDGYVVPTRIKEEEKMYTNITYNKFQENIMKLNSVVSQQ